MDASTLPPLPGLPRSPGELVVQSGRLVGRRLPLLDPRTLVGQAASCDVRLPDVGVEAVHCAILHDPAGLVLIDLGSPGGTRVNGELASIQRLSSNDVVEVGGCRFAVIPGAPPTVEALTAGLVAAENVHQALSVQAAAVAAQQAALFEEETRLDQRGTALVRQEEQLSSHLERRQRELDEQEAKLRDDRAALAVEVDAARQATEVERLAAVSERAAAAAEHHKATANRKRVAVLRRRLRKRHSREWASQEAALARREADVVANADRLARERAQVKAFQERLNGELELGRRQLRDDQQEFALEQQRWEEGLNAERGEQEHARRELHMLSAETEGARHSLTEQQREAEEKLTRLGREADGLDARVRHQRAALEAAARERPVASTSLSSDFVISPAAFAQAALVPEQLDFALQEVMDQRMRLAENWERFLLVQQNWEADRAAVLAALEADAADLDRREQDLRQAETLADEAHSSLSRQHESAAALRSALEAERARLVAERADWETRREELAADLDGRERLLAVRGEHLEDVHRRRLERRQEEDARLAEERTRAEEARRQYGTLWHECERRGEELARQEHTLAGRALAVERARQEWLQRQPDSPRAEAQLSKLEQAELSRLADDARHVERQRRLMLDERRQLDAPAEALRFREAELTEAMRRLEQAEANRDRAAAASAEDRESREQELKRLRSRHALNERQLKQLRDELEHLARGLMDDQAA